jgi:hypothetical protein
MPVGMTLMSDDLPNRRVTRRLRGSAASAALAATLEAP